jgi:tetratricopeptide (TPR) repeat protein
VKTRVSPILILCGLLVLAGTLATLLSPRVPSWTRRSGSDSMLKLVFGEGRKLFASHFFTKADVYFHSGYYPSMFDRAEKAPMNSRHMTQAEEHHDEAEAGHETHQHPDGKCEHESKEDAHFREMALNEPRDWIERFGRHFFVTEHAHLENGNERELLPWLKLSADLDPERIDTYTVAAYWLRSRLGKVREAELFLREGLKNNPDSYEILFELGRLCRENYQDDTRARNLWELALRRWNQRESGKKEPDFFGLEQIAMNLADLEEKSGHLEDALNYLQIARKVAPIPEVIDRHITEIRARQITSVPR